MRASSRMGRLFALFWCVAVITLALDQVTKAIALHNLSGKGALPLVKNLVYLNLIHNRGSAFGLIQNTWVLIAIGIIICVAILLYINTPGELSRHPKLILPLGLIFGGALGNLVDRLRQQAVIDFIDLRFWPVFNLADVALTAGVLLMALVILLKGKGNR